MTHPTQNRSLSQKLFWHLKVFGGAVFVSLVFGIVLQRRFFPEDFLGMLAISFIQLEIFIWLGALFFDSMKKDRRNYRMRILLRLLYFYLTVLLIASIIFLVFFAVNVLSSGGGFSDVISGILNTELNGFFASTLTGFGLGAVFFFYVQWSDSLKREQKLTQEKLIFQYQTLKNQVNPHFLFNSLNTLSSLVRENPDLSEEFIQKLSHIYRYILDDKEKELVPLSEEIKFVQDFFYLQKIRDEEKITLKIEIQNMEGVRILPVSLQLLVENALKHNSATRNNPLEIIIHNEGIDRLVVRNNLQKKTRLSESPGIGLKNLNERSKLILNTEIDVIETADEFVVKIPVKTAVK